MDEGEFKMILDMKADIASIKGILSTMVQTNDLAIRAYESAQSAHLRLNKMEKDIDDLEKDQDWLPKLITATLITGVLSGGIGFLVANLF